ncbi:peptidylprolyl isomerase [Streptococcus dentiloxodontae]
MKTFKKFLPFLFLALLALLIYNYRDSILRAIRGDDYVDSKIASKVHKEQLPQLSTKIADNEAEAILHTSKGDITVKLFPKYAPKAVENFLTHAKKGYYNNLIFHRVIANFMIQSGDPNGDGTGGESIWGEPFENEISPYLYNFRGALAMANTGSDSSNGSQFFINQNNEDQSANLSKENYSDAVTNAYKNGGNPSLDGNYTVFGQVIKGMDVVDSIASTATDDKDKPTENITITSIEITKDYNFK